MNLLLKLFLLVKAIDNFPTAILDKLGFVSGEVVYKMRGKRLMFIARGGSADMSEIAMVASGSEYDLNLLKLPQNPVAVDLGGNIGTFSIPFAKSFKQSKIFTFEPDADNYKILLQNIKLNSASQVHPINLAISDYKGEGYLKKENLGTDAYQLDPKSKITNCLVTTLPLAMLSKKIKKIDLLKIDIEGAEYNILLHKQSFDYIKKNAHYIFMEYHNIDSHHNYSLIKNLIEKNFKILDQHGVTLALENINWKN